MLFLEARMDLASMSLLKKFAKFIEILQNILLAGEFKSM